MTAPTAMAPETGVEVAVAVAAGAAVLIVAAFLARSYKRIRRAGEARRRSRERLYRDGMICIKCGYNMRAAPGRCSECGHVPGKVDGGG